MAGTIRRAVENAKQLCEQGSVPKPYDALPSMITSSDCWLRGSWRKRLS